MKKKIKKDKLEYSIYNAFINRKNELEFLRSYVNAEPFEILFLHGPKSSGKTNLLYKFFDEIQKEQKLDVKFLNLRKKWIGNYKDFLRIFFHTGSSISSSKNDVKETRQYGIPSVFQVTVEELKGVETMDIDPFELMEREFVKLTRKGIKPVIIIDELQALDQVYLEDDNKRQLIIELFNFFVAMTKESHLAHIIIASSDGYFLDTVYKDSRLKKTSTFYKIDYLGKKDVLEWLLNLEKYAKIKEYTLTPEEIEKIWDTVGGSMWEIQKILRDCLREPLDSVLDNYKKEITAMIVDYTGLNPHKKGILRRFVSNGKQGLEDFAALDMDYEVLEELLRDMVRNNILYYNPTEALYYPQSKSYRLGILSYFDMLKA